MAWCRRRSCYKSARAVCLFLLAVYIASVFFLGQQLHHRTTSDPMLGDHHLAIVAPTAMVHRKVVVNSSSLLLDHRNNSTKTKRQKKTKPKPERLRLSSSKKQPKAADGGDDKDAVHANMATSVPTSASSAIATIEGTESGEDDPGVCKMSEILERQERFYVEAHNSNSSYVFGDDYNATDNDCAILFFGLPRSFKMYVLPSIVENVFRPNLRYGCDYYVHYHNVEHEGGNREGEDGGTIHGDHVRLMRNALMKVLKDDSKSKRYTASLRGGRFLSHISITSSTADEFWQARNETLHRYETTLDTNHLDSTGKHNYLYFPWKAPTWKHPTSLRNLVKQWDSIERVWRHMEETETKHKAERPEQNPYRRLAMLRSDVVYVTPIDVWKTSAGTLDTYNQAIRIPDWANFPVNDRMVIGPYEAVKVWATKRFELVEGHVRDYPSHGADGPGWGMHSERFMKHTLLPAMLRVGGGSLARNYTSSIHSTNELLSYALDPDPGVCFLRARADGSVWTNDCAMSSALGGCGFGPTVSRLVEDYHGPDVSCEEEGNVLKCSSRDDGGNIL